MRRSLVSGILSTLFFALLPVTPASATLVASSTTIGFAGTAHLTRFPCPPPPSPSCAGSLYGAWVGHASGEWNSGVFDVSWENIGGLTASFTYWEHSCVEPTSAAAGSAYGSGEAHALPGHIQGNWQGYGELAHAVIGAHIYFTFDWIRAGTEAIISFRTFRLVLDIAGPGVTWQATVADWAPTTVASFAPTPPPGAALPTCQNPADITGQVAGSVHPTAPGPLTR